MKRNVSKYPELAGLHGQEYVAAWHKLRCRKLQEQNLTKRGTPRCNRVPERLSDLQGLSKREYNKLRARRLRARRKASPSLVEVNWNLFRNTL